MSENNTVIEVTLKNPGKIMDWFTLHSACSKDVVVDEYHTVQVLNLEPEILNHLAWAVGVGLIDSMTLSKGSWKTLYDGGGLNADNKYI